MQRHDVSGLDEHGRAKAAHRLDRLKGKWLLTLNDTASIRAIFHDCEQTPVKRALGINAKARRAYHELVIRPRVALGAK